MYIYTGEGWKEGSAKFAPFEPIVYESLRTYGNVVFAFEEHMNRLKRSASFLGITTIPLRYIERALDDFKKLKGEDHRFRIYLKADGTVFLEASEIGHHPGSVEIRLSRWRKPHPSSVPPDFKVLYNPSSLLARLEKGKAYEALMMNSSGFVAEGTFSNVFLVKKGILITPSLETGILSGITRKHVIDLARDLGIKVEERFVETWELFEAEEIFLTHTSYEIVPVSRLNENVYAAPGEITKTLRENFRRFILG